MFSMRCERCRTAIMRNSGLDILRETVTRCELHQMVTTYFDFLYYNQRMFSVLSAKGSISVSEADISNDSLV